MNIGYFIAKCLCRVGHNNKERISNYLRRNGVKVGKNCNINSDISTGEAYLIEIGDNVTISTDVLFITHDASIGKIIDKKKYSDLCGKIIIGNNCFIGARSTILYGVNLANNIIVAAGSVVTKSFNEEGVIIGGNPARVIGTWEQLRIKAIENGFSLHGLSNQEKKALILSNIDKLVTR